MKFGLLLPHFGEEASREKLLEGSKLAEDKGFDSVWVRDHLVFDFRFKFDRFFEQIELLGTEVLPKFRQGQAAA